MDDSGAFARIIKDIREARSAMDENAAFAGIVTGMVTLASAVLYLLWSREPVETIEDGGIDVDALLEDTPEAAEERRRQEQTVGLPAQQLLNALQKVRTTHSLST
jgi:pyrimidine operon attenuation protein/uracil phosphoribosyltransferase